MNVLRHWPEEDIGRIANRLPVPTAPWSSRETVRKVLETADAVPASQLAGAVEDRRIAVVALGKIAAGPNDAPHAEPWSKAEAMIALNRLGGQ